MALPSSVEEQIIVIDTGLKTLRNTQMLGFSEFKELYTACDRHHRDVKLGHLTGTPNDLLQKAYDDTQFYCILIRMLVEASLSIGLRQKNDLQKIYSWYLANKHVLHAAPRFGKAHLKAESKEALRTSSTSPILFRPKSSKSARKQSATVRGKSATRREKSPTRNLSPVSKEKMMNLKNLQASEDITETKNGSKSSNLPDAVDKSPKNVPYKVVQSEREEDEEKDNQSDAPRNTPLPQDVSRPRMIHTIASLVNPHVHYQDDQAAGDSHSPQGKTAGKLPSDAGDGAVTFTAAGKPPSGAGDGAVKLSMWQAYQEQNSYGQDVLGKLQFCGRSGTPYGVRYVAHGNAETPEQFTSDVVSAYSYIEAKRSGGAKPEESHVVKSRLEDFYKQSERYYPHNLPKYPSFKPKLTHADDQRLDSAQSSNRSETDAQNVAQETKPAEVKLDTLVTMIDSVTDDMSYYKEKIAPGPSAGFTKPVLPVDESPAPRPKTCPPSGAPPTAQSDRHLLFPTRIQPPETSEYNVHFRRESTPAPPSSVVQAVDSREKVEPDITRYKWQDTGFGSHTYVKKLGKQRARSAGASSAGSRPKTAPMSTKEKWKTERPSDANQTRPGAATHGTKEIDSQTVDSLVRIYHLCGTSPDPGLPSYIMMSRSSLGYYFGDTPTIPANQPPNMEYLSFIAPKNIQDIRGKRTDLLRNSEASDYPYPRTPLPPPQTPAGYHDDDNNTSTYGIDHPDVNDLDDELLALEESHVGDESYVHLDDEPEQGLADDNYTRVDEPTPQTCIAKEEENGDVELSPEQEAVLDTDDVEQDFLEEEELSPEQEAVQDTYDVEQDFLEDEESLYKSEVADTVLDTSANIDKTVNFNKRLNVINLGFDESTLAYERGDDPGEFVASAVKKGERKILDGTAPARLSNKLPPKKSKSLSKNLSASDQWNLSLNLDRERKDPHAHLYESIGGDPLRKKRPLTGSIVRKPEYDVIQERAQSAVPGRILNREQEMAKKMIVGPIRSAPSIPSPFGALGARSPRTLGAFQPELDQHARKLNSPKRYMQKVSEILRHEVVVDRQGPPSPPPPATPSARQSGLNISGHALIAKGELTRSPPEPSEQGNSPPAREDCRQELSHGGGLGTERAAARRAGQKCQVGVTTGAGRASSDGASKSRHGRPIPDYGEAEDPDDVAATVERHQRAKAAVDIQRIFRGYVARISYKQMQKLDREKREGLEDKLQAEREAQRKYREHLKTKEAIKNRGADKDAKDFAMSYDQLKGFRERERKYKGEIEKRELAMKNYQDVDKREQIGPHVYIYQSFHPKQIGPTDKELNLAATIIQRHVRGFLVRKRFEKLERKAAWHSTDFRHFMRDYKGLLKRIQRRHGIQRPKTPFSIDQVVEFMDTKKRYESVFDHRSFGGELDFSELSEYFSECDLYPSQFEVDEAFDAIFRGKARKKTKGLSKKECNEMTFELYPPEAAGVKNERVSTWMNPIINGIEAMKFLDSDQIGPTPLGPCVTLVSASIKERRDAEQALIKAERLKCEEEERIESDRLSAEKRKIKEKKLAEYLAKNNL